MPGRSGRGFTLVELLVVVALAGVVLGALGRLLLSNQQFYRSESQVLDVEQGLRAVAQLIPAELRELSAQGGDILAMGRDSITIRAMRSLDVICALPSAAAGEVVVADSLSFGWRMVDPARDRALVFRDGDPATADDDRWLDLGISSVNAGAACGDGSAGTTLHLAGPTADLDSVSLGSPLRTYERVTYRLYADDQGLSWLGERGYADGSWSALSPVAGPLRRVSGLSFAYYDSAGVPTAIRTAVARISVAARGLSTGPIEEPGRATSGRQFEDSVVVQAALRND
jgi:prepilin-type N-terminal cleavage/methylation domain-containing protein